MPSPASGIRAGYPGVKTEAFTAWAAMVVTMTSILVPESRLVPGIGAVYANISITSHADGTVASRVLSSPKTSTGADVGADFLASVKRIFNAE